MISIVQMRKREYALKSLCHQRSSTYHWPGYFNVPLPPGPRGEGVRHGNVPWPLDIMVFLIISVPVSSLYEAVYFGGFTVRRVLC